MRGCTSRLAEIRKKTKNTIRLAETHQVKRKDVLPIDILCDNAKKLYNFANYEYRKAYFENERLKKDNKPFGVMPKGFDLMKKYAKENLPQYRAMPAAVAQRVVRSVDDAWGSFLKGLTKYNRTKSKRATPPKPPKYKDKQKGRSAVTFPANIARLKLGQLFFPDCLGIKPIPTKVTKSIFCEATIVPCGSVYKVFVIYKKEAQDAKLNKSRVLSIDLGVTNLATMVDNTGERQPIVVKGGRVKAENQWYNKRKGFLESCLPGGKGKTRQISQVCVKRKNRIGDALHKTSRFIVNYCLTNNIGTIIVGKNDGWKKEIRSAGKNNQNFIQIPHEKLVDQIRYKAALFCIDFVEQEESYTSKCDALALESVEYHKSYLGKRRHRGLFVSSTGKQIHADVNGALNIMRKAIGDHNVVLDWGRLARPASKVLHG